MNIPGLIAFFCLLFGTVLVLVAAGRWSNERHYDRTARLLIEQMPTRNTEPTTEIAPPAGRHRQ